MSDTNVNAARAHNAQAYQPPVNTTSKPSTQSVKKPLLPKNFEQSVQETGPQQTVQQIQQSVNQNQNPLSTSNAANVAMKGV